MHALLCLLRSTTVKRIIFFRCIILNCLNKIKNIRCLLLKKIKNNIVISDVLICARELMFRPLMALPRLKCRPNQYIHLLQFYVVTFA